LLSWLFISLFDPLNPWLAKTEFDAGHQACFEVEMGNTG
jgi:hypothetical protein